MTRGPSRRWMWLLACAVGLLVLLDGTPRAEAAPETPGAPAAPAAPADHEGCYWKTLNRIEKEGDQWRLHPEEVRLECGDNDTPDSDEEDHLPEPPEGCRVSYEVPDWVARSCASYLIPLHPCGWEWAPGDDEADVRNLSCPDTVQMPTTEQDQPPLPQGCERQPGMGGQAGNVLTCERTTPGTQKIDCRDEVDFGRDHHRTVEIPADPPPWYLTAVELESNRDEGQGCDLARHPPHKLCKDIDKSKYDPPGLLPDDCWGTYPTALYQLSWEDGDWKDVGKYKTRIMGWIASFLFAVGRSAIQIVLWLVEWAFTFDVTEYSDIVTSLAGRYQARIVGPWSLVDIAWFILVAFLGITTLRGRIALAGGELLVALVVTGLATVLFTNRAEYFDSVADAMTLASDDLFAAGTETGTRDDITDRQKQVLEPLQLQIHEQFVEEAYMYLNWGASSDELGAVKTSKGEKKTCLDRAQEIASTGWDGDGWPAMWMGGYSEGDKACDRFADFNRDVSTERVGGALLTMAVALVVSGSLGLMAVTLLLAKFLLAVLFALTPFVAVFAILPGSGRRVAWTWLGTAVQAFVTVIVVSWMSTIMLLGSNEMLTATQDMELHERWGLLLLIVVGAYVGFQRARNSGQTFGSTVADALTRLSPAAAGWSGGGPVGVDFKRADAAARTGAKVGGIAAAAPVVAAGTWTALRWRERRNTRRSLRNMRYMERQRTRPALEHRVDTYQYANRAPAPPSTPPPAGAPAPGPGPTPGPVHPAAARALAQGGVLLTPKAPPAPKSPPPSGPIDGEVRERFEYVAKYQSPPSALRHPIRHVQDRVANRFAHRQTDKMAARLHEAINKKAVVDEFQKMGLPNAKTNTPRPRRPRSLRRFRRGWP